MAIVEDGTLVSGGAKVESTSKGLLITWPGHLSDGTEVGGGDENGPAMFFENDPGVATGGRFTRSPEVDSDYRLRIAHDTILDRETFNYVAQNTGKFSHVFTTMTATVSAAGMLLNSGSGVATATGMTHGTHAMFPVGMGATAIYCETSVAFSAATPPNNVVVDIGMFLRGASTAFAPTDGVFFRFDSAGMIGVISRSGVETTSGVFPFTFVANRNYLLTISISEKRCRFWIDDVLMAVVENVGAGQPYTSAALPWSVRQANVGAAGGVFQTLITDYVISLGGALTPSTLAQTGNRSLGSYQGLSGGVMGSLAGYANSANPTATVPTNTTSTVLTALGGQGWETGTIAVNTDAIIMSYQNPAGTVLVQGRRLVITGIHLMSYVQTVLAGGPLIVQWSLAFGHTAVSLATGETASFVTATTKAPRRIALPAFTQAVTAAQAVSTIVSQPGGSSIKFDNPIYVNPGEFVALVAKKVGTVLSAGVFGHVIAFDYGWE